MEPGSSALSVGVMYQSWQIIKEQREWVPKIITGKDVIWDYNNSNNILRYVFHEKLEKDMWEVIKYSICPLKEE
jgi:hypothetical protein